MASRIPNPFARPVKTGTPVLPHGLVPLSELIDQKYRKPLKRKPAPTKGTK